jgi:hypothetical protein
VIRDMVTDESTLEVVNDQGAFRIDETGTVVRRATNEWYRSRGNDVTSVQGETVTERSFERDDWHVRVRTRTLLTSTADHLIIHAELDAFEGDPHGGERRVHADNWHRAIPRDQV